MKAMKESGIGEQRGKTELNSSEAKFRINILACGLGPKGISLAAQEVLNEAELVFGAPRLLESYAPDKDSYPLYLGKDIKEKLREVEVAKKNIAILVSGDSGFYSATSSICEHFKADQVQIFPGISSVAGLAAKLKMPWQNWRLLSLHGRTGAAVDTIRRERYSFFLLGDSVSKADLKERLLQFGLGELSAHLAENLGLPEESLCSAALKDLPLAESASLAVLMVENPKADARVLYGLPEEEFIRGKVPMTKSEIRAVLMSKLAVAPEDLCWDVGAGTGSVSIEMALAAYRGEVYAIEYKEEALDLIKHNLIKHKLGNLQVIAGKAPESLLDLPAPDLVFIGGSGGNLPEIVKTVYEKNPCCRIVITSITWETSVAVFELCRALNLQAEYVQVSVNKAKVLGNYHLLMAENPVQIFTLQKAGEVEGEEDK